MKTQARPRRYILGIALSAAVCAQSQQWKVDADARIEQYRKGGLSITVTDGSGNPLPGVPVQVRMRKHAFGFGTAIGASILAKAQNGDSLSADQQKQLDYTLQYFNMVTFENDLKWRFESANTATKVNDAIDFADANGLAVRGHTMIWPHDDKAGAVNHDFALPDGSFSNSDIVDQWNAVGQADTPAFTTWIQQATTDRINRMASTYAGRLAHWDVLNEPNDFNKSGGDIWLERRWSGDTIDFINPSVGNYRPSDTGVQQLADIRAEWLRLADAANPGADLYVNNFNLISQDPGYATQRGSRLSIFRNILDALNDPARVNAPGILDGIGMQAHFGGAVTDADTIYERLERHAVLDRSLDLSITEYDYTSTSGNIESNEAVQLEYALTQFFSHPQAEAFVMWGFWDGAHWKGNAPLFDSSWNLKPSGQAYTNLVFGEWWTDESGTTDANGEFTLDAFHGEHLITATVNGAKYRTIVQLDPENTNTLNTVLAASGPPLIPIVSYAAEPNGLMDVTFVTDSGTNYTVYGGTNLADTASWLAITNLTGSGSDAKVGYQPAGQPSAYFLKITED